MNRTFALACVVACVAACVVALPLEGQSSPRPDGAVGMVWGSPLSAAGAPSILVRVGFGERHSSRAALARLALARLALEALIHPTPNGDAVLSARSLVGIGYDARIRPNVSEQAVRFVAGTGVYRTVGLIADQSPAWFLAPRVGVAYDRTVRGVHVGAEVLVQSLMIANLGAVRGALRRPFLPVSLTIRF